MIAPRLLLAAHGTESGAGSRTLTAFRDALAAARPGLEVALCFLDVARPSLAEALAAAPDGKPTVVVPLLLSTGYHVQTDIPAVVGGRPHVLVTPHLGPDPLVVEAVADRLPASGARTVALVGVGSSRPAAAAELRTAAALLARRLGLPVTPLTLAADITDALRALPAPVAVGAYLLAEGRFSVRLAEQARTAGAVAVSPPLGAHPALVRLVLSRYDAAAR